MKNIYKLIEENKQKINNKDLCAKCGGRCCKHAPCYYLPKDIGLHEKLTKAEQIEVISKSLDSGESCIISTIVTKSEVKNGLNCIVSIPVLSMEPITINGGKITLFSVRSKCALLGNKGCTRSDVPSGGKLLVPNEKTLEEEQIKCRSILNDNKPAFSEWLKYEDSLIDVVCKYENNKFSNVYKNQIIKVGKSLINKQTLTENEIDLLVQLEYMQARIFLNSMAPKLEFNNPTPTMYNLDYPNKQLIKELLK